MHLWWSVVEPNLQEKSGIDSRKLPTGLLNVTLIDFPSYRTYHHQ